MIKINKKAKKIMFIAIPILIVMILVTVLIGTKNKQRYEANNNVSSPDLVQEQANIYLASEDRTLVPLTVKYNKKDTLGENLLMVLNLIKEDSPINSDTFHGLVPEDAKVNELSLNDNKILNIDFDEGLFEYDEKDELNILESITWTMTEFEDVDGVSITVDGNPLSKMPRSNTPVAKILDRSMGINHFLISDTTDYLNATNILSYYSKTIDKKDYLIPVSQYVDNDNHLSVYDLTISKMLEKPSITSRLKVAACLEGIELETASTLKDNNLQVSLNEKALFDEESVQTDIYNLIRASLINYQEIQEVSFLINEQEVMVNGYNKEETFSVSSIVFNEYYI